jgi:hypothetical protein
MYLELMKNPVEGFSAGLVDDNDIYEWEVLIIGPPDTVSISLVILYVFFCYIISCC